MEINSQAADKRDNLVQDLKAVINDAEELLKSTGQQTGDQLNETYRSARNRFEKTLQDAKVGLSSLQDTVATKTKGAVDTADTYVRDKPWQSVGIGALAGLVIGFLMLRK